MNTQVIRNNLRNSLFLLTVVAQAAFAAPTAEPLHYLSDSAIELEAAMPPAPKPGSPRDERDFEILFEKQRTRTNAECVRAGAAVSAPFIELFAEPYGPLSAAEVGEWRALFSDVRGDTDYFVQKGKKFWARPRPYMANPEIDPCVTKEVTYAYPSGHAAIARVFARLLSKIDPSRTKAFQDRADQIAADRILAGVHHPSDIIGGKILGDAIAKKLLGNRELRQRVEELRLPQRFSKKSILMFLNEGFQPDEYFVPRQRFEAAGYGVVVAARYAGLVHAGRKNANVQPVTADLTFDQVDLAQFDGLVFVGGGGAWTDFFPNRTLHKILHAAFDRNMVVGLICAATGLLATAENLDGQHEPIAKGRHVTGYAEVEGLLTRLGKVQFDRGDIEKPFAVADGNLVTGRDPSSAAVFADKVIAVLR